MFNILRISNASGQYDIVPRNDELMKLEYGTKINTTSSTLVDNAQIFSNYTNKKVYEIELNSNNNNFTNLPYILIDFTCQVKFSDNTTSNINNILHLDSLSYSDGTVFSGYRNIIIPTTYLIDAMLYVTVLQTSNTVLNIKIESANSSTTQLSDFTVTTLNNIYLPNVDLSLPNTTVDVV